MKKLPRAKKGICYIYGLVDPRSNKVRYVGVAASPYHRLYGHLHEHINNPELDTYKVRWIKKLIGLGTPPRMVILETLPREGWEVREKWWIAHYRHIHGNALTNSTEGGEGWNGMHHSEDTKKKCSEWQRGRKLTEEHRRNISLGLIGRPVSEQTREKRRVAMTGKKMPPGHGERVRKKALARYASMTVERKKELSDAVSSRMLKKDKRVGGSSKYLGVCWNSRNKSWQAGIRKPKSGNFSLGQYDTEAGAASAYNRAARELYGPGVTQNVIPGGEVDEPRRSRFGKKRGRTTSSEYLGVIKKGESRWEASVCFNAGKKHLGYFDTEKEAAQAYNDYVVKNSLDRPLNPL